MQFDCSAGPEEGAGVLKSLGVNAAAEVGNASAIEEIIVAFIEITAVVRRGARAAEEHGTGSVYETVVSEELKSRSNVGPNDAFVEEIEGADGTAGTWSGICRKREPTAVEQDIIAHDV